jgi:hypothetical protein
MPAPPHILQAASLVVSLLIMGLVPGHVLARRYLVDAAGADSSSSLALIERWFLVVVTSLGVTSIVSLALAQLGQFSLAKVLVLLGAGSALVAALPRAGSEVANGGGTRPASLRPWASLAILLLVAGFLFTPPFETALWGDDATVYVGFGASVSATGAFLADDELVQSMSMAAREELFRNRTPQDTTGDYARFPGGIAIPDLEEGRTAAGFSPLFPVWVALFHQLADAPWVYYVAPFFGLLGITSVFFAGRALSGDLVGFLAAALLTLCLPQVWFSSLPMSEGLAQFLVFSGLWALFRHRDTGSVYLAAVAGALLGTATLARFDLLPMLLLALTAFVAVTPRTCSRGVGTRALSTAFAVPLVYALAHLAYFPSNYGSLIRARLERLPLGTSLASIDGSAHPMTRWALVGVGLGIAAFVVIRLRRHADADKCWQLARGAMWTGIAIYALAYFVSSPPRWTETIPWLAAYVSWPLLVVFAAGVAGMVRVASRLDEPKSLSLLILLTVVALHYLHNPQVVGGHVWVMRRFVPIVLPAMFLVAAAGVAALAERVRRPTASVGAAVLAAAMLLAVARPTMAVMGKPYWSDGARVADELAGSFAADAVLLVAPELAGIHLPVTLTYQYGIGTIQLQQRRPASSILHGQIVDWLRAGRPVYLAGADADLHFYGPGIALSDPMILGIEHLVLETTDSPPPRDPATRRARITVFRVRLREVEPKRSVDVGDYAEDALFVLRGFHAPESSDDSASFRWTGKEASIEVPAASSIGLLVAGGRPPGVPPAKLSVWIDDEPVLRESPIPDEPTRIALRNPDPSSSEQVTVRLRASVFTPRDLGVAEDDRELGVRLFRVDFGE